MHARITMLALLVMALGVGEVGATVHVVTTHADLAALTKAVGGERVTVTNLTEPTQDPHFVDARPSLMLALNKADLLVLVGLELEVGWLPNLLTGARNPDILPGHDGYLDTSGLVERKAVPTGPVDRSMGDLHPGGNPHFTRDPRAALQVAAGIARRLGTVDPEGASEYRRGYAHFERDLKARMAAWEARLAPHKGRELVAYHESWVYFADWLGLRVELFVEPKPGIPPDPSHVARLLQAMRSRGVRAILQEEYYPDATARLLADKSGARLLAMPGGVHVARGERYEDYIDKQVNLLCEALSAPEGGRP